MSRQRFVPRPVHQTPCDPPLLAPPHHLCQVTVDLHDQPGQPAKVVMLAQKCRISGSKFVEQFDINRKVDMNFRAELKWKVGIDDAPFSPVAE